MIVHLPPVIEVDEDKCINCHVCISACPVKFCNNGSGNSVIIDPDLCIGCGACIVACSHGARSIVDDFKPFWQGLQAGEKMVAIVAPSIAANCPGNYLNLNGWLKSSGIEAVFDVSFGAELAVKSYIDHIQEENPETIIAQHCSSIVTFIEIYHPELIPYLAPVDSPMIHTIKMIKEYYPQYRNHKVLVVSPCVSKKREFDEVKLGDYNVVFQSLQKHIKEMGINLEDFPAVDYDGPAPERAVLFPTPGGLLRTAKREFKGIADHTRKIEGVHSVYKYLVGLPKAIKSHHSPLLVDCLSCELGCNAGPGTLNQSMSVDEFEHYIEERRNKICEDHTLESGDLTQEDQIHKDINDHWQSDMYKRKYRDLSDNNQLRIPNEEERKLIYQQMNKQSERDVLNCAACGYGSCEDMATAIFNGLNKAENCHFYRGVRLEIERKLAQEESEKARQSALEAEAAHQEVLQLMEVCQDIEKRRQVEQELREKYEMLDSILQNMPIMMDAYDENGQLILWNRECERITGYSAEEIVQADALEKLYPDPCYRKSILRDRTEDETVMRGYETQITCADGAQRTISWYDVSREHPIPGWSRWAFGVDLTERKYMEARLDRLNAVGEMTASIAHEIRNPMTTVRGFLQLLYSHNSGDNDREFFPIMIEELDRANAIITEYLSIASNKAIELQKHNLNTIIKALYPIMMADATLSDKQIDLQLSENISAIQGDQMEIRQLILNLVRNGLEAMGPKGTLIIRTIAEPANVVLEVQDEGVGILPQHIAQLYTPFFTTKESGTGLGLSVCYSIASRHRAQLQVNSRPGKTVFSISFPVAE